jgi:hypothetical protein
MSTHEELSERMKKAASSILSSGELEDNSNMPNKGVMNVYNAPKGREEGTLNARWGDNPPKQPLNWAGDHSTGVVEEAIDDRRGVLERVFDGLAPARDQARAEIAQLFEHGQSGEYEAHAAVLGKQKTASVHVPDEGSLTDRVRSILAR